MNCVLLCAGFATRMYPLTKDFPKPLLEVAGVPVLDYLLRQVIELPELREVHLVTNARFFDHFVAWSRTWEGRVGSKGARLQLHNDGATGNENRLGAVGDLGLVLETQGTSELTMVVAGDNIFRFALLPLATQASQDGRNYVVALPEPDPEKLRRTGVLELGLDNRVLALHEKPAEPPSSWACPPLYFFQEAALRQVSDYLQAPDSGDAPGHFVSYLCPRDPVYAFTVEGERLDIGSQESYENADRLLRESAAIPSEGDGAYGM